MTAHQVMVAGAIVAAFSFLVCAWQLLVMERVHWLWMILLLTGLVAFGVSL